MGVHFQKTTKTKAGYSIYAVVIKDRKRLKYNTGVKIDNQYWNPKKEEVKNTHPQEKKLNGILFTLKSNINSFLLDCKTGLIDFTLLNLEQYIDCNTEKRQRNSYDLIGYFKHFVELERNVTNINGEFVKPCTVRKYELTKNKLDDYIKRDKNLKGGYVRLNAIDERFFEGFILYLTRIKKHTPAQIKKDVSNLKTVLKRAEKDGYNIKPDYRDIKVKTPPVENVVLHPDELLQLYNYKMSDPKMEKYRIIFLIGCFTGARPSDYINFTEKNITVLPDGQKAITYHAEKTGKLAIVPINKLLDNILKDYNYILPRFEKKYETNGINRKLKEICRLAGLNRQIELKGTKGGEKVKKSGYLWEFVVGKTAKRTFVTLLHCVGGKSLELISTYTRNTIDTLRRYLVNPQEFENNTFNEAWEAINNTDTTGKQ